MDLTELSETLAKELTAIPRDAEDVCPLCRSGRTSPTKLCLSCECTSNQVKHSTKSVIPISYYKTPSPLRERMHNFKEHDSKDVRNKESRAVAAIFARYMTEHGAALAAKFGPWDALVAVPSTKRSGAPALQTAIENNFPNVVGSFSSCLTKGAKTMSFNQASEGGFETTEKIKGKSFLLLDDTFTTGARLQSAHHALTAAGALVPVSIVITRKINPSTEYGSADLWERQTQTNFSFKDAPWWKN